MSDKQDTAVPGDLEALMAEVASNHPVEDTGKEEDILEGAEKSPEDLYREQAAAELRQMQIYVEERKKYVKELLAKSGVDDATREAWKNQFGSIYTFAPNEEDLYVWRPIYKAEWDSIQRNFRGQENAEDKVRETVVKRCVIYPQLGPQALKKSRAGLMQVLSDIIMEGSYFFNIDRALNMVTEL